MRFPSQSLSPKITYCLNFVKRQPRGAHHKGCTSASKKREATLAKVMLITMTEPEAAVKSLTGVDNILWPGSLLKS